MPNYKTLRELIAIDSPSGYTEEASQYIFDLLKKMGWHPERTNKGAVKCALGKKPSLAIAAHVDTLGGMVSNILPNGNLRMTKLGGIQLNGYEGGYCRIVTSKGKTYTGTLLIDNPAAHVNNQISKTVRTTENMHIRLDEVVENGNDTQWI